MITNTQSQGAQTIIRVVSVEWARFPEEWVWGLEDYSVIRTEQGHRLMLCRLEEHLTYTTSGHSLQRELRRVPIKISEIPVVKAEHENKG